MRIENTLVPMYNIIIKTKQRQQQRRVKTKWRKRTGNTHIILNKDKERLRRAKIPRYFKSLAELMHHQERRGIEYVYYKKRVRKED